MKKKINIRGGLPFTNFDEITSIEIAASFLSEGTVNADGFGITKPLNVRLDVRLLHFIDFIANRSGVTRTRVVENLLEAGVQAAFDSLTEEQKEKLCRDLDNTTYEIEVDSEVLSKFE
nr:hypothetical protein [Neisseria meningitidis]